MRNVALLCTVFFAASLLAQPGPLTEGGLKKQTRFIEAKQEALLGKTKEAIGLFTALAEEEPENDAIQFELGRLQFAAGATPDAIDHLRKAYATRPNEVYAAFLAELYEASGRHSEGAELFTELIRTDPSNEDYYLEKAAFLVRAQDIKGAVAVYNELEKRIGTNAELSRRKHALYLGQGDQKRAEKELLDLVAARPEVLEYQHLLAGYYTSQGETAMARKVYQTILTAQPADVRAQLALQDAAGPATVTDSDGQLLELLGRSDINIDLKIGKLLPLVQEVARTQDAGLGQRAMQLATELRRVHPDEAKAAALMGDLYFHTSQYTAAAEAYRATLALDDTVYPVWEQLLAALYLDNQITELRKYAEEALDIYPNRPAIYVHYAVGEVLRADFAAADALLRQAQLMVSGQPEANAALATLQEAITGLEAGDTSAKLNLAQLPGGSNGPLGQLWAAGDRLPALSAAAASAGTNALLLEKLGDAQAAAGDKAAAAKSYASARAAGSKSGNLSQKLSRVGS